MMPPNSSQNCAKAAKNAQFDALTAAAANAAAAGHLPSPFAHFNPLALEKLMASHQQQQQQQQQQHRMTSDKALSLMRLDFSRQDLDLVLYGSVKPAEQKSDVTRGVALSGLRVGELSYGKIRIGFNSNVSSLH